MIQPPTSTEEPSKDPSISKELMDFYNQQIERLEERIENQEGMIALLTQGFAEVASSIEATMEVLADQSEDIKIQLEAKLLESKKKMIGLLNVQPQDPPKEDQNEH